MTAWAASRRQRATTPSFADRAGGKLAQRAYAHVKARILNGGLPAGTVLAEEAIGSELGMSKTPARQALKALLIEGYFEIGPHRQMRVRSFSPSNREELLEVREALERLAITHACLSMSHDEIDFLHTILRRQKRAAETDDQEAFIDLDEELHLRIAAGSDLRFVPDLLARLRGFVRLLRLGTRREDGHLFRVLREHESIVRAIENRDLQSALTHLGQHLHTSNYPVEVRKPAPKLPRTVATPEQRR